MKKLRVLFILLLALLLPVRGAVAGIMACAPANHAAASGEHHSPVGADQAAAHEHAEHQHVDVLAQPDFQGGSDTSHNDSFCVSFCSPTPLLSSDPILLPNVRAAPLLYPSIVVPAPSFFSGGQERPPRTI